MWRRRACTPRFTRAMVQSSEIGKHTIETACVLGTDVIRLPQVALPLGRFLREDVATVCVAALVLAGGGLAETLGRRPVGLDLGHCNVLDGVLSLTRAAVLRPRFPSLPLPACKSLIEHDPDRSWCRSHGTPAKPGRAVYPLPGIVANR
ncbi:hypothetical protein XFF6166_380009 [Xanthomonas citri pv. fuscans]|nr:hypothetical protein XFF6166_380009 [Xanthomonas citri pv. fuscans]SOO01575.1 hypothetical protein XFF6960_50009 [Xanthomonas citri pv. fuscans]SOO05736.1 hypothetical protein XFF7767_480035 [Xanthomonas citri pv. fuscans]SOO13831.1 hypothetical protein XFF7766_240035 [Xanthomonas citri pv. fuscans]SOO44531.1 hypothetical protein XFF1815_560009 [Xanthomonas citri pv. fuscans]